MEPKKTKIKLVLHAIFQRLILSLMMIKSSSCTSSNLGNKTDHLALLEFKNGITEDPNEILSSWNESYHYCQWSGVTCGRKHQRVRALNLNKNNLFGSISPHVSNLSFLRFFNLMNNRLHGEIPQEIGRLSSLQRLFLANNTLEGAIPSNISYCKDLNSLFLGGNKLMGEIPVSLGSLNNLLILGLNSNSLRGEIPKTLGNLSSLQQLSLAYNYHLQGRIPNELSKLANLTYFAIGVNNLSEYGTNSDVTPCGDQYSYGIILLEMMTGKRPTDDIFKDGFNLRNYVKKAIPRTINKIIAPELESELVVREEVEGENDDEIVEMVVHEENTGNLSHGKMDLKKSIISILTIALACSEGSPAQRIDMNDALRKLHHVRKALLSYEINRC